MNAKRNNYLYGIRKKPYKNRGLAKRNIVLRFAAVGILRFEVPRDRKT